MVNKNIIIIKITIGEQEHHQDHGEPDLQRMVETTMTTKRTRTMAPPKRRKEKSVSATSAAAGPLI